MKINPSPRSLVVGEWCVSFSEKNEDTLDPRERELAVQAFGNSQQLAFQQSTLGHFFWNIKIESGYYHWNLLKCFELGWIQSFAVPEHRSISIDQPLADATRDHRNYWNTPDEDIWHFETGFRAGWTKQEEFIISGNKAGRLAVLAQNGLDTHLKYWLERGQDYSSRGWIYFHGYVEGLQDYVINL